MISNDFPNPYRDPLTAPQRPSVPEIMLEEERLELTNVCYTLSNRANARGKFLRIVEKSADSHAVLIVPDTGLAPLLRALEKLLVLSERPPEVAEAAPGYVLKVLPVEVERKQFVLLLEAGANGRIVRIAEKSYHHRDLIIVPVAHLAEFIQKMAKLALAAGVPVLPAMTATGEDLTHVTHDMVLKEGELRLEHKSFRFQLKQNQQGRFLRILEMKDSRINTLIIPAEALDDFKAWIIDLAKTAKKKPAKPKAAAKASRPAGEPKAD